MQARPPQSEARCVRKFCVSGKVVAGKADSGEGNGEVGIQMNSERTQRGHTLRQKTLPARFINRGNAGVENYRGESSLICRDGCSDSCRSGSNDDDVAMSVHSNSQCRLHEMPAGETKLYGERNVGR